MKLSEVIKRVDIVSSRNVSDCEVSGVKYDSRKVLPGDIFIAVKGFQVDGNDYIDSALKNGAAAVVSEKSDIEAGNAPVVMVKDARKALSDFSVVVYDIDFKNLLSIGITGTNGKTTTASLFYRMLNEIYPMDSTAMFGTVEYIVGDSKIEASRTTPESSDLIENIRKSCKNCNGFVMEVASHALELNRIENFEFDIAVWTNLTQDHLDFHKTMENYYLAKKKLFTNHLKKNGVAIINIDDLFGKRLSLELEGISSVTYGKDDTADVKIISSDCNWYGTKITVEYKGEIIDVKSTMVGDFNVYNIVSFIAGALSLGIDIAVMGEVLDTAVAVKGRMEKLNLPLGFNVVVDYAHTPDALINVLGTARKLTNGKLITVFGCGGDRDRGKRALMGRAVARKSDMAIVTTDNPRYEKPSKIVEDILDGIPLDFRHTVILDRAEAIRMAFEEATDGDCIIIAGKGHENYQEIEGVKYHFDDVEEAMKISKEFSCNE